MRMGKARIGGTRVSHHPQTRPFALSYAYTEGAVHDFRLTRYAPVKQEAVRLYLHCADYGIHL